MVMEYSPQFSSLIGATFGEEDEIMTRSCPSCSRVNESRRAGIPANTFDTRLLVELPHLIPVSASRTPWHSLLRSRPSIPRFSRWSERATSDIGSVGLWLESLYPAIQVPTKSLEAHLRRLCPSHSHRIHTAVQEKLTSDDYGCQRQV
jgi:hypothetical protein